MVKDLDMGIIYSKPQVNKFVHELQRPAHIITTKNTLRACPTCRGTRQVAVKNDRRNTITMKYCFNCMGTGQVFE